MKSMRISNDVVVIPELIAAVKLVNKLHLTYESHPSNSDYLPMAIHLLVLPAMSGQWVEVWAHNGRRIDENKDWAEAEAHRLMSLIVAAIEDA